MSVAHFRFSIVSSRRGCRAFTLVELLVVIAIIGVLVGLLMPAIVNARLVALQTTCANNQKELATAIALYDSNKDRLPYVGRGDSKLQTWYDQILEELGLGQQYQDVNNGTYNSPPIKQFKCPVSDAPLNGFSYVVNVGNSGNWQALTSNPNLSIRSSGLFFYYDGKNYEYKKSSISSIKDGASNTILLSEKCFKRIPGYKGDIPNTDCSPRGAWDTRDGDAQGTYRRFGMYWNGNNVGGPETLNTNYITSRHAQVNNIAFADGSVKAVNKAIQYGTFKSLMCPNDKGANVSAPLNDPNYP